MSEAMVTMAEVATAMGRKPAEVEAEARALNLTIRPDWMNRPACRSPRPAAWQYR